MHHHTTPRPKSRPRPKSGLSLLTASARTNLIKKLNVSPFPDLQDLISEFVVRLINVALGLDRERRPHEGEQGRVEVHGPVRVERHVHGNEALKTKDTARQLRREMAN